MKEERLTFLRQAHSDPGPISDVVNELLDVIDEKSQTEWRLADTTQIRGLVRERNKLAKENQRLIEALEFYADSSNYDGLADYYTGESLETSNILLDGGQTARKALQESTEKTNG